jgi:4-hydroxybenzoate polyprenyltransferase
MSRIGRPTIAVSDGARQVRSAERSAVLNLLVSLRPNQWTKNFIIFAGLIFGQRLFDPAAVARASGTFAAFCGLSGVVYLINDIVDREQDRWHPVKRSRPIASGALTVRTAITAACIIGSLGLGGAFWISARLGIVALVYLALLTTYSIFLKHVVILDVLTIAVGFVLRAVAGAVAVGVPISHWLLVCTILLALFLALSKRRHELVLLAEDATGHRPILEEYSPYLLDQMIGVVTASTVVSYMLYTTDPETAARFGTRLLGLTIPLPLYGIFRYLYLVHQRGGGTPSELLLTDRPLVVCVALWALVVVLIIYRPLGL